MDADSIRAQVRDYFLVTLAGLDPNRQSVRQSARGEAPEGLASEPASAVLGARLEYCGHLIRLGERPPDPWPARLAVVSEGALTEVLAGYQHEVATWPWREVDSSRERDAPGCPSLVLGVRRRDDVESALRALTHLCLPQSTAPLRVPGLAPLQEALGDYDRALAALGRVRITALLGARLALQMERAWLSGFPS